MRPRIDTLDDRPGLEILDPIENHRYFLYTDDEVRPSEVPTESFAYPVSVARRVHAASIRLPYTAPTTVRSAHDGAHILDVGHDGSYEFDADDYLLEVSAPLKLYLRVSSSLAVNATTEGVTFEFGDRTGVEVGARSFHTSPAATVTVPDDPAAVMKAVSTFGSALKATTCERSWPTLRGHPPKIERGDELSIPEELSTPDTGVTLAVPADYEHVLAVAPLAYYFGATVVPSETPELRTETGFTHRLDAERGFEDEAIRVLKQAFLLDCVTRTEGVHPMDLAERSAIESNPAVNLDFAALYDRSLAEQLEAYLSVPRSALADELPTWHRVTHVRPSPDATELLPYVANDLSVVRVESPTTEPSPEPDRRRQRERDALSSFKRGTDEPADIGVPETGEYVPLPEADATERAWVGDGTPVHGAKLLGPAFDHTRSEPTDGVIDVTVVCNDEEMREEWDAVSDAYGERDVVAFDVECRFDVPTDELRELLAHEHDLFHFVGHIDGRGLQCPDGILDAESLDETGATTILLNACRSHDQGIALVEAGARAAIVSWGDVDNLGAVEVGETFARLLNYGFGVGNALEIVEEHTAIGRHYVVVGDPGVTLAQCVDGNPMTYDLDWDDADPPAPNDEVAVTASAYATRESPIGSVAQPYLRSPDDPDFYLLPGQLATFRNAGDELEEELGDYSAPVVAGGELRWSNHWFRDEENTPEDECPETVENDERPETVEADEREADEEET